MLSIFLRGALALFSAVPLFAAGDAPELDYLFFKERVQPILRARCASCHTETAPRLAPGADWDNDQSRRHFAEWSAFVSPGSPRESALLMKPLAGGDAAHASAKPWATVGDAEWITIASWVRGRRFGGLSLPFASGAGFILAANTDGDGVHVIDPVANEAVGVVEGVDRPGGMALSPDGRRIYVSDRGDRTLAVVDVKTLETLKRIPLTGEPAGVVAQKDGARVYVGLPSGVVDVIDARSLTLEKSIPAGGPARDVSLTPDNIHVFATAAETAELRAGDVISHDSITWTLGVPSGVRAVTFIEAGDGATRSVVAQLESYDIEIIDFGTRETVNRIRPKAGAAGSDASGLAFSPDAHTLWAAVPADSNAKGAVVAYRLPAACRPGGPQRANQRCEWVEVHRVDPGARAASLAMSADGASLYAALPDLDAVAVIDTESAQVTDRVAVGSGPSVMVLGDLATR